MYRAASVAVFDFRIRLSRGVFSDDNVDHEFESCGIMPLRRGFPGLGGMLKYLKS
jgi:hypothetical protein